MIWEELHEKYKSKTWCYDTDSLIFKMPNKSTLIINRGGFVTTGFGTIGMDMRITLSQDRTPEQMEMIINGLIGDKK